MPTPHPALPAPVRAHVIPCKLVKQVGVRLGHDESVPRRLAEVR